LVQKGRIWLPLIGWNGGLLQPKELAIEFIILGIQNPKLELGGLEPNGWSIGGYRVGIESRVIGNEWSFRWGLEWLMRIYKKAGFRSDSD